MDDLDGFWTVLLDFDGFPPYTTPRKRCHSLRSLPPAVKTPIETQITPTQRSTTPADGTMGTPDPDYGGVGIGPGARHGFGRKLQKKT